MIISMEDSYHQSRTLKVARSMDHQSTQSGTGIGSNEALLTEILIRLPATSILRFKSVCTHWRLLLTHKHFTLRYDNNSLSKFPLGLFGRGYSKDPYGPPAKSLYFPFNVENRSPPPFRNLSFYFNRSDVSIVQSCNGLLLCCAIHNGDIEYYVFNPTTKQLASIPSVPKTICSMALAFHQTHCVHYKVVCILDLYPSGDFIQVQVYSSDTRTWKICIESFSLPDSIFDDPVYWNGAVYWSHSQYKLLQFKLDAEELQMLPLPVEMMTDKSSFMYFGESRGHLHLVFHTEGEEYILHVYEMLTDHSGWFVKYLLQFDRLLRDCPFLFLHYEHVDHSFFLVADVVRGKEEEDSFLVLSTKERMLRYNVHDKGFNEFYNRNDGTFHPSRCHSYIETLSAF